MDRQNSRTIPSQKRDSGSNGHGAKGRKKRRSYSSVVQAWFETLSDAIQDGITNNSNSTTVSTSTSNPSSPLRKKQPRRNAFVLHMMDPEPVEFLEIGADNDDLDEAASRHQNLLSPLLLTQDMINVAIDSDIENADPDASR